MRDCWGWGRTARYINENQRWPEKDLMLIEPRGRTRFLSDDELATLLAAARKHSTTMYAAIVVSIATGVRQGELLRLNWLDIDLERQLLRVHLSKNDEPRTVHLPQSACDALRALQNAKVRAIGPIFITDNGERFKKSTLEARWKRLRDSIPLANMRSHDLRHSCASYMAQSGATLLEIGAQLGHRSPSVTLRYAHLTQGKALPSHAALDEKLRG